MQERRVGSVSGHVFLVERAKGPQWYAKYRRGDGRQIKERIGPAWTRRGRAPAGFFTRSTAEAWLQDKLTELDGYARRGAQLDVTFVEAAEEWLRHGAEERGCKPSTMRDYRNAVRNLLVPVFGDRRLVDITPADIEVWRARLTCGPRQKNRLLGMIVGIYKRARRAFGIAHNPAADVDKMRESKYSELEVYSPEEIRALVRAAQSEQDGVLFLTAAFTGLRKGELLALRWRDVDFAGSVIRVRASYSEGELTTPKSGKVRAVPVGRDVAAALARLGQRDALTGDEDLVFPGICGGYLDGSALYHRFIVASQRAGLRRLRFHGLRHTFGTTMIAQADILKVKEWMGHASVQTTMRYLHFKPRPEDALLVDAAFAVPTLSAAAADGQPAIG